MDLAAFIADLIDRGAIADLAANRVAQFGPRGQYIGAQLLPERTVPENSYTEYGMRYMTVIANDGSRYGPSQKKGSGLGVGAFDVRLGNQDVAAELTSRDFDALIAAGAAGDMQTAANTLLRFVDTRIVQALAQLEEKQRWDALVDAAVVRTGDNGYTETVTYPDPAGHRVTTGGDWTGDYDPMEDINGIRTLLRQKGYTVGTIVAGRNVMNILQNNVHIRNRAGSFTLGPEGEIYGGLVGTSQVNSLLNSFDLPAVTEYDEVYFTQDGVAHRFVPDDAMVFVSRTGRDDAAIDYADLELPFVTDMFGALGYTGIGRAAGQTTTGRVIRVQAYDNKPPRIEAEGWQTSFPVITEYEAVAVIRGIGE